MHELGTVFYVIQEVEKVVEENHLTQVASVTLEVGEVSGIIPYYLTDCWKWAVEKSQYLKGAELKIETLPAVTYCEDCKQTYPTVKYAKICPHCKSEHTYLLSGNEYTPSRRSKPASSRKKSKRGTLFGVPRVQPVGKPQWFSDKRPAVCCAQNLCADGARIPHLQPERYFLSRTCRERK